jgi:hypothetical protein
MLTSRAGSQGASGEGGIPQFSSPGIGGGRSNRFRAVSSSSSSCDAIGETAFSNPRDGMDDPATSFDAKLERSLEVEDFKAIDDG